jgi:hypothetical protein
MIWETVRWFLQVSSMLHFSRYRTKARQKKRTSIHGTYIQMKQESGNDNAMLLKLAGMWNGLFGEWSWNGVGIWERRVWRAYSSILNIQHVVVSVAVCTVVLHHLCSTSTFCVEICDPHPTCLTQGLTSPTHTCTFACTFWNPYPQPWVPVFASTARVSSQWLGGDPSNPYSHQMQVAVTTAVMRQQWITINVAVKL